MMEQDDRQAQWKRNVHLEGLTHLLNGTIEGCDPMVLAGQVQTVRPVFIIGAARSGTTVLLQYLACTGLFGYPSNFISRFWGAPYLGALTQKMMLDPAYSFRDELVDLAEGVQPVGFRSALGKTAGALSPNEFWYFWRRFFQFEAAERYDSLAGEAGQRFVAELKAWQGAEGKPLAMKAMIANWNLLPLADLIPSALFVYVKRERTELMASLLRAREQYFGDKNSWYSFQVPYYERFRERSAEEQVAAQVCLHEILIEEQLRQLSDRQYLAVQYEPFCQTPDNTLRAIWERMPELSGPVDFQSLPQVALSCSTSLSDAQRLEYEALCRDFYAAYNDFKMDASHGGQTVEY